MTYQIHHRGTESTERDPLTGSILGAAIEVHRELGPGLLESAYEECLCRELSLQRISFERQVPQPVVYKDVHLDCGYRMDIVVKKKVVIEINPLMPSIPSMKHKFSPT